MWAWSGEREREREQWEIWPKIEVRPKEFHWRCKRARQRDATNLIEMPARNHKWEMRDEHSERDLWWKIENRKWIYYDIRKTRKLWKPKGAGEGEGCGECGASANENEANEINFSKSPTTQKQKENRSDLTNMLPVLTRTPAHKKQKERATDREKEREAVQEIESERALTHSLAGAAVLPYTALLDSGNCFVPHRAEANRSTIGTLDHAELPSLSLTLSLSCIVQRRGPPYAKDLFLGAIHRRDARLAMLCCCAEGGQISMSEAKHIALYL